MYKHCAIVVGVCLSTTVMGDVVDDFESYSVGGQPGGTWQDATDYISTPTNPGPTTSIINTTDAFGNATQATQIQDGIGTSGGILANVGRSSIHRFETDLRLDQAGNGSAPNWIAAAGYFQETIQSDFNWMPQAVVYATRTSNRFRLFVQNADGRGGAARDFGLGAHSWSLDTWYRISIEVDTMTGVFETSIVDIETGEVLSDVTRTYNGWNREFGQYDLISVNDGEYGSNQGTIGNMASIDNVNHVPTPATVVVIGAFGMLGSRRRRS